MTLPLNTVSPAALTVKSNAFERLLEADVASCARENRRPGGDRDRVLILLEANRLHGPLKPTSVEPTASVTSDPTLTAASNSVCPDVFTATALVPFSVLAN